MKAVPKIQYTVCNKGGFHLGEALNMVCLEPQCQEKQLSCCACVQEFHKDHNTKPLKLLMLQSSESSLHMTQTKFNIDITIQLINGHLKESMNIFSKKKKEIDTSLLKVQDYIIKYYSFLIEQVKIKNIDPKIQIQQAFDIIQSATHEKNDYVQAVKRISSMINIKKSQVQLNEADIITSINGNHQELRKNLIATTEDVTNKLTKYVSSLQETIENTQLWKIMKYKFSATLKHADVKVLSDTLVKSTNVSGYKFAIMEPNLQKGGNTKFSFKIKETSSNWIAVGVCHPKIIASKSYGFNFNQVGHGAYMVSANGGSWSNISEEKNNKIKAFKFVKGDIIKIDINKKDKTIIFEKNTETYVLSFDYIPKDELSPCVLFYYLNDEVQFIHNHSSQ